MEQASKEAPGQIRVRERIDTFCARAILALIVLILAWGPLAFGGMPPASFLVIQSLTVVAVALWAVRFWSQRPLRLLWPPMCWAVLAFCLYALARCRCVEVEYAGRQQLIHVLVYGALFFVVLNNLNRRRSATIVSMALIAVGFALAFLAVFQFATHYPRIWGATRFEQYMGRGSGTFVNPNHLAGFLGMIAPLALAFTVMSRLSPTVKVLLAYSVLTMLAGIVVSVSRGGIVAEAVALAVFCVVLLAQRDFWKPALAALVILLLLGFGFASQFTSLQKRFGATFLHDKVADDRPSYWDAAERLFARDRLWGVGPGHFDIEFPSVRPVHLQVRPQFVHNDYLNALCEWGVVGMAVIAAACGLLSWGVLKAWRGARKAPNEFGSRNSDRAAFVAGAAAGLLAVMLHCVVEFNMQIPAEAVTAVTLMALLTAHLRFATERFWEDPGRMGKILLTAMAAALVGYLSVRGARKGAECCWLARASGQAGRGSVEGVVACVTKAHEAEPMNWETDFNLGEYLWKVSLHDNPASLERAKEALTWYGKAMGLNPFDAYSPAGCGMCLDVLGRRREATPYFLRAERNDPLNGYIALEVGRHCAALGDYQAAQRWLEHALSYSWTGVTWEELQLLRRHAGDPVFMGPK